MQLVIKYGAILYGTSYNIVMSHYADGASVPMDQFPGCVLLPFTGELDDLKRIGPTPTTSYDDRFCEAPASVDLVSYAAAKRFMVETGGVSIGGAMVATDRESQSMIGNAYSYVQASGAASVAYKGVSGFVTLSADQIKSIALGVGAFVQACFEAEADVQNKIKTGEVKTTSQVDTVFAKLTSQS